MITENDVFREPKLKIEWANHHITALKNTLNTFVQTDFYRVSIEEDVAINGVRRNPPIDKVTIEITRDAPSEIPLIIGDVIHNLRSSLDIAICEMIEGLGGTLHDHTHFPIRDTREEVVRAIHNGAIRGATTDIETILLEIMHPYKGGNDILYAVHSLDIMDKHRKIIPTYAVSPIMFADEGVIIGGQTIEPPTGRTILTALRRGTVKEEYVFSGMKPKNNRQPMLFVYLNDLTHRPPGQDVIQMLLNLTREVRHNLETLAKEYVALLNRTVGP